MVAPPSYPLPALHPFTGMDAWSMLVARAELTPEAPFLTWQPFAGPTRSWSYRSFAVDARSVAAGLRHLGVRGGDRVIIHMENCPEFPIAWFACAALGAVAVTTNARSAADEMRYFAEDSEAVGAITQSRFEGLVSEAATHLKWCIVVDEEAAGGDSRGDEESWTSLFRDPSNVPDRVPEPGRPMSVQYTSGTTSRPKGVVWTHANALWAARINSAHEYLVGSDCHLISMPLFHANAFAYSLLPTIWVGGRAVLMPKWSTSRFWDVSRAHGCTWASLMGLSNRAVLGLDPPDAHSYRYFGSLAVNPEFEERFGVSTIGWWGMTETVSHGIVSNPWQPTLPMTIGRPAPEYDVRVVGPDEVTTVAPGETGSLQIRGVPGLSMFAEYLNQPAATADSHDAEGWFRTGDLVTMQPDGCISFADRVKDMLRVGSENVAASEIERVILEVSGVQEAAVVGRPDPTLDEVPVAFVVGSGDDLADRVAAACQGKLADFKVPRQVSVVRALPRSTISKVNKATLRSFLAADTPLEGQEEEWVRQAATDPSGDAH
ncbi:MAG: AMP-binding protein [Sciscionella sp.]